MLINIVNVSSWNIIKRESEKVTYGQVWWPITQNLWLPHESVTTVCIVVCVGVFHSLDGLR